ncbi:MAG: hypothetical protein ACREX8_13925, partial [Gammaproteobacteria bacterium]
QVRYYVDEQLAGVGLGLMALRSDVVVASHPPIADFPRPGLDTRGRSSGLGRHHQRQAHPHSTW